MLTGFHLLVMETTLHTVCLVPWLLFTSILERSLKQRPDADSQCEAILPPLCASLKSC